MDSNYTHALDSWWINPPDHSQTLQEPVPFEDFKFSFGLDSDLAMVIPPVEPSLTSGPPDPMFTNNVLLDEDDQKAFSEFLDTFLIEQQEPESPKHSMSLPHLYHPINDPEPIQYNSILSEEQAEERRRSSILQSLDEQKRLHQRLNLLATMPRAANLLLSMPTSPQDPSLSTSSPSSTSSPFSMSTHRQRSPFSASSSKKRQSSMDSSDYPVKRTRHKDLLTEEEKRANHIASEQKRRSTIRSGFKDLTDLVPTLKNINNSKSTVLFKAVDFIKHLEKRNRGLRDKIQQLEARVRVQGVQLPSNPPHRSSVSSLSDPASASSSASSSSSSNASSLLSPSTSSSSISSSSASSAPPTSSKHASLSPPSSSPNSVSMMSSMPFFNGHKPVRAGAAAALMIHKSQQQQLLALQEQLQIHQKRLAQQQEMKERALRAAAKRNAAKVKATVSA
ncbi:uncharacterized protein BYT42DRAFT_578311 [Radiomyces spectabilis]|uniref:uncharacterized protein n=1 Tax=Radiomyces spectabilis TaxID=64574 RepID=UPI00221FC971|nr:uncharacterized protein BYT42DRAFT_578311 [Radiomyces spectabilis]KAI8372881.1 hypothetical protein BYT42DRAFT_578311 [Radiomyces spectabilis]